MIKSMFQLSIYEYNFNAMDMQEENEYTLREDVILVNMPSFSLMTHSPSPATTLKIIANSIRKLPRGVKGSSLYPLNALNPILTISSGPSIILTEHPIMNVRRK